MIKTAELFARPFFVYDYFFLRRGRGLMFDRDPQKVFTFGFVGANRKPVRASANRLPSPFHQYDTSGTEKGTEHYEQCGHPFVNAGAILTDRVGDNFGVAEDAKRYTGRAYQQGGKANQ